MAGQVRVASGAMTPSPVDLWVFRLFLASPCMTIQPMTWAVQRQTADRLGISERTLHRWRHAGLLKVGQHYRRKFPSPNSPLLYHLERCEQAMAAACARPWQTLEQAPRRSREQLCSPDAVEVR